MKKIRKELQFLFVILVAIIKNAECHGRIYPRTRRASLSQADEAIVGNPLFLTPLIESGKLELAREKARVQHPQISNVKSYAGFFTVNNIHNSNLFFWFFPAKINPQNATVLLYLEGGPGASSLFGLFTMSGRFYVTPENNLESRENYWSETYNVIYIDNPVGSGFSFTDSEAGYARTEEQIGRELRIALVQFFQMFDYLRTNDFYVIGESYGGKYVPALCYEIHYYNPTVNNNKINLKGFGIGNGYTDPVNQLMYGNFLYEVGLIDDNGRNEFLELEAQTRQLIRANKYEEARQNAMKIVDGVALTLFKNLTGYNYNFDIRQTTDEINIVPSYNWVQRPDVRCALNVGNVPFDGYNERVEKHLQMDNMVSQANEVAELLEHYRGLIFTGNLDIIVGYSSVRNYLNHLSWSGAEEYKRATRKKWFVDGELAGYVKIAGNLVEVMVRNAGHLVPMDQPAWALDLLKRFTKGETF